MREQRGGWAAAGRGPDDAPLRHVYLTETLHAAAWGAQLARGDGEPRFYVVEPTGELEDDPNVTDKRFPGNPTRSYRTLEQVRVARELADWPLHSEESVQAMRASLATLRESAEGPIIDCAESRAGRSLVRRVAPTQAENRLHEAPACEP